MPRPFEAFFVCETCRSEVTLYADAFDARRVKAHAKACPGPLKLQRLAIDPKLESAYALGARGWPFLLEPR
jgi:hypothetical protein